MNLNFFHINRAICAFIHLTTCVLQVSLEDPTDVANLQKQASSNADVALINK